jgi:hypothetical protein
MAGYVMKPSAQHQQGLGTATGEFLQKREHCFIKKKERFQEGFSGSDYSSTVKAVRVESSRVL